MDRLELAGTLRRLDRERIRQLAKPLFLSQTRATRVVSSGDKGTGFTWQLDEDGNMRKSGKSDTQAKAVIAGQEALIEYKRKWRWDPSATASEKIIPLDKLSAQNDT